MAFKVYAGKNTIRVHQGNLHEIYEQHPEIFEEVKTTEVGDLGWTRRIACLVRKNRYGVPEGWQTYGWLGWTPHQAELEDETLTIHDAKFYEVLKKSGVLDELEQEGYKVVEDIHPREELIKIFGALPKTWVEVFPKSK